MGKRDEAALRENCPYLEFSGPYFPAFRLKTVSIGENTDQKTPNTNTFHAVKGSTLLSKILGKLVIKT